MAARLGQVLYALFSLIACDLVGFFYLIVGEPLREWHSFEWVCGVVVFAVPWAIGRAAFYILARE
jgi:hypothetical protein